MAASFQPVAKSCHRCFRLALIAKTRAAAADSTMAFDCRHGSIGVSSLFASATPEHVREELAESPAVSSYGVFCGSLGSILMVKQSVRDARIRWSIRRITVGRTWTRWLVAGFCPSCLSLSCASAVGVLLARQLLFWLRVIAFASSVFASLVSVPDGCRLLGRHLHRECGVAREISHPCLRRPLREQPALRGADHPGNSVTAGPSFSGFVMSAWPSNRILQKEALLRGEIVQHVRSPVCSVIIIVGAATTMLFGARVLANTSANILPE